MHLVNILGALPSLAIPYSVRVAMYWSEFAAESVKTSRLGGEHRQSDVSSRNTDHALMMLGRTLIPAAWMATTKGDAEAPPAVPFFDA